MESAELDQQLALRLLRPERATQERVLAWAKTHFAAETFGKKLTEEEQQHTWESFDAAGFLPNVWERSSALPRVYCSDTPTSQAHALPSRLEDFCCLAADLPGLLTAEALALETCSRLRAWGAHFS